MTCFLFQSIYRKSNDVGKPIEADKSNTVAAFASRVECSIERQQTEAGMSNSTTAFAPGELIPIDRQQTQTDVPSSVPDVAPHSQVQHDSLTAFPPQGLVPIEPNRLNGRNYNCWMHQMYFFLNQLNIAYVLTEPCPSIPLHEEASSEKTVQAKAAARKWIDDDYLCRRNILNSLSDHLFDQYSKKVLNAKELWEELKISFNEDFGTKRSQVNKYIQFQMVDGVSVVEQVQELHNIADSIIASGMWIDENFHVSAIVSKLPPSWKECRVKLMQEEFLPLNKLMYTLRVEEESRNRYRNSESSKNARMVELKLENNVGLKKKEMRRLCYTCGNEGHIAKSCPLRKFAEPTNGNDNYVVPVSTEVNMVERNVE